MRPSVKEHCAEINRCNQRGGRMLSILDLIERGTLDIDLAAFLMARISGGDSFLVGARPGGAGKTTVMAALLNLIPVDRRIIPATRATLDSVRDTVNAQDLCVVCHEISPGHYYSYLWGKDLRDYCSLVDRGCMLATNLHADTLEEARDQICADNQVPVEQFNAFAVQIFLRVEGGFANTVRRIDSVYVSNGNDTPQLVFSKSKSVQVWENSAEVDQCRSFLQQAYEHKLRTIEEVRGVVLDFPATR